MSYLAFIKDRKTGVTAECRLNGIEWDEDSSDFWWSEGNMSCDCNRFLLHYRALHHGNDCPGGEDPYETWGCVDPELPKGRFSVVKIVLGDGQIVYEEKE